MLTGEAKKAVTENGATQLTSPPVTIGTDYGISKTEPRHAASCVTTWDLKAGGR